MHKYMILRGDPNLIRRVIEDLRNYYYSYFNKKTGQKIGMLQLMPREIKTFELVFPSTALINIKKDVQKVVDKHNSERSGLAIHWGPTKRDKYKPDGEEFI